MKKKTNYLLTALLFSAFIAVLISACKKDEKEEEENITPVVVSDKLTADLDGVTFVASTIMRQKTNGFILVMGKKDPQTFAIMFPDTCKVKSYPLNTIYPNCYINYGPTADPMIVYISTSGTITFTEFSSTGKIKATFNGVITKQQTDKATTINVTNGAMEVN